jgi:Zn-dependent peptidase ImmA (M78 family)/transcriptional regulator with XRE-family HTH domain
MPRSPREIIGSNLRVAREAAGMSQEAFAQALEISRQTLSAIENGHVAMDSTKLIRAADVLGTSVSSLLEGEQERLQLLYRAAEHSAPEAGIRSQFQRFCRAYRELEELVGVADASLTPPEYAYFPDVHANGQAFARQVARYERERLGLGQLNPVENIFKLLEENGVRILLENIAQPNVFGLSAYSRQSGACVLVNNSTTVERQIFTLAHEYGHLLMHRSMYKDPEPSAALPANQEMERMANTFAAHFLVPDLGLRDRVAKNSKGSIGFEDVLFLKTHFRVSAQMLIKRLCEAGLIGEERQRQMEATAHRLAGGEDQEYRPIQLPIIELWQRESRFDHLAREAALTESASISKLAELLDTDIVAARQRVQAWRKEASLASA